MRHLTRFGLVVLATTAIAGFLATSAFAQQAVFSKGNVTGTQTGTATLSGGFGTVECQTALSGETTESAHVASMSMSGTCSAFGSKNTIKMNGCKAELTPGWEAFGFGPSECGPITISLVVCQVTILPQDGLLATYENAEGGVNVSLTGAGLRYKVEYGGCGSSGTFEDGEFHATWHLSGTSLSYPGETSLFAAEKYPATLAGAQEEGTGGQHVFHIGGTSVKCTGASFGGSLSEASESISLSPTYSGCTAFGFINSTVSMNGCTYRYWINNFGQGKNNPEDIVCPPGKEIRIKGGLCTVTIPPQAGLHSINYALLRPSAAARDEIEILSTVESFTYTVVESGFLCPLSKKGTFTDGTYNGKTLLEGLNSNGLPVNIKINV